MKKGSAYGKIKMGGKIGKGIKTQSSIGTSRPIYVTDLMPKTKKKK